MQSSNKSDRFDRQIRLPELGKVGQEKLDQAKVLVIGAGGLGCPVLLYLAAAGVGKIGIADFDTINLSNLHRQVLYQTQDIGTSKVLIAKQRLKALYPYLDVCTYHTALNPQNALEIIQDYDIVVDGTDNFSTRYLINDACVLLGKVNVYASIFKFEGQVSVFNFDKNSPHYRDLFPSPPSPQSVPNCAEIGVLGVLAGMIGTIQATEVIKVITGIGQPLVGKLFILNALTMQTNIINFGKQKNTPIITQLADYEELCKNFYLNQLQTDKPMKTISVQELKAKLDAQEDIQVIDVREPDEYEIVNIGALLIPMGSIEDNIDKIRKDVPVILHCRSGARSANVLNYLAQNHGFDNLYNLTGGVLAYADEIDPSLTKY